jgi:hypothetical protein
MRELPISVRVAPCAEGERCDVVAMHFVQVVDDGVVPQPRPSPRPQVPPAPRHPERTGLVAGQDVGGRDFLSGGE